MQEMDVFDRKRVRSEYEIELLEKLRHLSAVNDCMLTQVVISWLITAVMACVLGVVVNL